jgi:hypothetical protein
MNGEASWFVNAVAISATFAGLTTTTTRFLKMTIWRIGEKT